MSEQARDETAPSPAAPRPSALSPAATETFVAHRNLLFTVAYEILGSATDAEDVLQETWLRWVRVDLDTVRDRRAYLVRIAANQAVTRLRTLGRRRESYVGCWLPEPLLTAPEVADDVELAESVSMAMLLVLETLTPTERAVFVLREVFGFGYDEIARAVDKSVAAVRQIAHRARSHVAARRPRGAASPEDAEAALAAFQRAIETGDVQGLVDVLAPDVVAVADGGGVRDAVLRPLVGAEKVARLLSAGPRRAGVGLRLEWVHVNGGPGFVVRIDGADGGRADGGGAAAGRDGDAVAVHPGEGEVDGVLAVRVGEQGVSGIYYVRNPEKLSWLGEEMAVSR
ncbi:MAG TPA: RNA polymerase sigma-70 factor [Acidimicrobiales bacterium]